MKDGNCPETERDILSQTTLRLGEDWSPASKGRCRFVVGVLFWCLLRKGKITLHRRRTTVSELAPLAACCLWMAGPCGVPQAQWWNWSIQRRTGPRAQTCSMRVCRVMWFDLSSMFQPLKRQVTYKLPMFLLLYWGCWRKPQESNIQEVVVYWFGLRCYALSFAPTLGCVEGWKLFVQHHWQTLL